MKAAAQHQELKDMKKTYAVMAGNIKEFRYWQRQNPEVNGVYVDHPNTIRGRVFTGIIKYGTWYAKKDAHEMEVEISSRIR